MFDRLKELSCVPIVINGMPDHVHLLFAADYKRSLMDIMRLVKGETSYWANSNKFLPYKLQWQDSFSASSVSERSLGIVKNYILNQKAHHQKVALEDEINEMNGEC